MNPDQIRQLVRQEIQAQSSVSRFTLNTNSRHIHNGTDSPLAYQPIVTYVGSVTSTGGSTLLPAGWTVDHSATGVYTITHNLNTSLYVVTGNANSTKTVLIVTNLASNSFTVNLFETIFLALASTDFYFSLTVPVNNSPQVPVYKV